MESSLTLESFCLCTPPPGPGCYGMCQDRWPALWPSISDEKLKNTKKNKIKNPSPSLCCVLYLISVLAVHSVLWTVEADALQAAAGLHKLSVLIGLCRGAVSCYILKRQSSILEGLPIATIVIINVFSL